MRFELKDNSEFKILPLLYDGNIIYHREVLLFIFNGVSYYTECSLLQNTIIRYNSVDNYHRPNKIKYSYRYIYNVYYNNKIGFIIVDSRIHNIIESNREELFDINNNKHIIINKDRYGDFDIRIYNIEWDKKSCVDEIEWIIRNQSNINFHISSKIIKNFSIFDNEFISIYNKLISKNRDDKIEKIIYNLPK